MEIKTYSGVQNLCEVLPEGCITTSSIERNSFRQKENDTQWKFG